MIYLDVTSWGLVWAPDTEPRRSGETLWHADAGGSGPSPTASPSCSASPSGDVSREALGQCDALAAAVALAGALVL